KVPAISNPARRCSRRPCFHLEVFQLPSQKFSRKYLTRHKKSGQLWRRAARLTPGGVESNVRYFKPHPFLADYGDGGYIYDVDGNKILDLMMGFGALLLGHNNRDIALEVIKQLESGSMLGVTSELFIDYIQAVRKAVPSMKKVRLCKRGTVLIFDEVLTGFRLAYGGAQEYYDIRPDMTTFGKIAGGGFQLAGFGGEAQIMNVLEPGRGWKYATFHAGTYNGHPISVAAGLKGLEILGEHPEYYDHINGLGRQLYSGLQDLADDRRIPAWVEYVGSIGNVYFTTKDEIRNFRDTLSANTRRWWNWFIHCLGNNVLFGIPNTGERAIMCTEHTEEDVEWALEVADNAFAAIGKEARRHKEKAP